MARGSGSAQAAGNLGNSAAATDFSNANNLYSTLTPQLESQAANPTGYNPADMAAMQTGAQQSAGGTQAGAVGEGGLLAARTKNAGAAQNAVSSASRGAGEQLSKNALGISVGNARLKEEQRQAALGGLQGLTGTETAGSNAALGEVAANANANTGAQNASWDWTKLVPEVSAKGYSF